MNVKKTKRLSVAKDVAMLPGYLLVTAWCAFTLMILLWVFSASVSTTKEIFSGAIFKFESGIHFENFVKAWTAGRFSLFFFNSAFYVTVSGVLTILIASPAAYVLSRFRFAANRLLTRMFITGMSIPVIMIIIPLYALAIGLGLTNQRGTLTLLYTCINIPFSVFFLMAYFRNLPSEFEQAAVIDGCSQPMAFWRIMLPLARPGLLTLGIFNILGTWNDYFLALIFANQTEIKPMGLGLFTVIQNMKYNADYPGMFAGVFIGAAPTIILFICLSNKIMSGVTAGGVKQ